MTWIYVVGSLVAALGAAYALRLAPILRNRRHYEIREIPDFLTPEECAHLIEQARPLMVGSSGMQDGVVGVAHSGRTSSSAFLSHAGDRVIRDIKQRIAELTETPIENQEGIQITHYRADEHYEPHFDSLREAEIDPGPSGDRLCTVILYLNDDYEGGHTAFPRIRRRVEPKRGKALLFYNLSADGESWDPNAIHAGETVTSGEKWISNQWIHQRSRATEAFVARGARQHSSKGKKRAGKRRG